jgi:hypothetical protein
MKKLYHFYNPKDNNRVKAGLYEVAPEFVINHICNGEIDPVYDVKNDRIIDIGVRDTKAEIEVLRQKTETEIDAFISPHVQKLILRQVEIPIEIMQEYNAMRAAYGVEKQIILDK